MFSKKPETFLKACAPRFFDYVRALHKAWEPFGSYKDINYNQLLEVFKVLLTDERVVSYVSHKDTDLIRETINDKYRATIIHTLVCDKVVGARSKEYEVVLKETAPKVHVGSSTTLTLYHIQEFDIWTNDTNAHSDALDMVRGFLAGKDACLEGIRKLEELIGFNLDYQLK
jgi:hypothetical protein